MSNDKNKLLKAIEGKTPKDYKFTNRLIAEIVLNHLLLIKRATEQMLKDGITLESSFTNKEGEIITNENGVAVTKKIIHPAAKFVTDSVRELKLNSHAFGFSRDIQMKLFESLNEKIDMANIFSSLYNYKELDNVNNELIN